MVKYLEYLKKIRIEKNIVFCWFLFSTQQAGVKTRFGKLQLANSKVLRISM